MNEVEKLVVKLKESDKVAFTELYHLFESSLINHLFHMLGSRERAEELFHESMIKMAQKIHYYEPRHDLTQSFKSWLFRLATNLAIDDIRKNKKRKFDIEISEVEVEDHPHDLYEYNDTKIRLDQLISKLPSVQKTFLNLKLNEDLSLLEIATICGCNTNTVKQGLFRARKSLKDLLLEEGIVL